MYINPFIAGVLATILFEMATVIGVVIYYMIKPKK